MIFRFPGVGKSSIINDVKGEKVALEGAGITVTSKMVQGQINIIDCPGFSIKGEEMQKAENKIKELFLSLSHSRNFIHCALYVFNANTKRTLFPEEVYLIEK